MQYYVGGKEREEDIWTSSERKKMKQQQYKINVELFILKLNFVALLMRINLNQMIDLKMLK